MTNTIGIIFFTSSKQLKCCYSRFKGMQMCLIPLLLIFIASCNQQDKASQELAARQADRLKIKDTVSEPITTTAAQPVIKTADGDPSFILTPDTISKHGPNSITRNVLQDKNGNIWLATWEGIVCYDGKLFANVTLKEGLRHFHVFSILEDNSDSYRNGNLWFGTVGGGVYRYDPVSRGFTLYTTSDGLANNNIMCMLQDKAGNIWFGTGGNGVSCYDGNTFTNFTTQDGLSNNFVSAIAQDKSGKLWFGTNGGISFYDPSALPATQAGSLRTGRKSFTDFTHKEDISFHNVRAIIEDKTGNIWIGSQEGLFRYNGKSLTNIRTSYTSIIFEDKTGNLWMNDGGTNSQRMVLYRYDGKSFTEIAVNNGSQATFLNQIFGITQDRDGNIWFGSAIGVYRYDPAMGGFTNFNENSSKL